jgi:hypothetical protein
VDGDEEPGPGRSGDLGDRKSRKLPSEKETSAPEVNRQLKRERRPLNRGNATLPLARMPDSDDDQFVRAAARLANPDE